jgi:DNA polymerase-2
LGRLEDGRSFAAVESRWRPFLLIGGQDRDRAEALLREIPHRGGPSGLEPFSGGEELLRLDFSRYTDRNTAARALGEAGIPVPGGDMKPPEAFFTEKNIRGPVEIRGESRPGRRVDLVFPDPELSPPEEALSGGKIPLKAASIDIETDLRDDSVLAISLCTAPGTALSGAAPELPRGIVRVRLPPGCPVPEGPDFGGEAFFHPDEASLLRAFLGDVAREDPDVLTGWNFLDFDFPRLAARAGKLGLSFALGRSGEGAKFFPGEGRRSAAALVPGRQVIDALRIVRSGPRGASYLGFGGESAAPSDYTLETVAQMILGEGKLSAARGEEKLAELERLYREEPWNFAAYCYRDAWLVLRILAKTGLWGLTLERAVLTGVSLDKAWTSVASFERIYGLELRRRGIAPPPALPGRRVSGAAGGTVLESLPGITGNVAVFDFRSLYPTIMRTFNLDPLAHERARGAPGGELPAGGDLSARGVGRIRDAPAGGAGTSLAAGDERPENGPPPGSSWIIAPNGAEFSREPGPLPALIAGYFAGRRRALEAGDTAASQVYKILMNSFYGVLGTAACRYGRTELAGAITSFARKWLLLSRDWFIERGFPVLYGDTDSLFVETGLGDGASYGDFARRCGDLARDCGAFLAGRIREEYGLESFIELRFEKAYRRLLIPPLRSFHAEGEARGRAKGYAGYLLREDGGEGLSVEVKGMEAVRSDATPLARRLQVELLALVFSGGGEERFREKVLGTLKLLRQGKLDGELVYRKRLSRAPESYTASTPPQVKAARALGWHHRRGTVEFVWTRSGPAPASLPHGGLDYDHYTDSQVLPVARSIAEAAGWKGELFPERGRGRRDYEDGQLELGLSRDGLV